jgi:hypothetical protein
VPEAEGFTIRLPSAQLGDLIQINCMNRVRGVFRLTSGERVGYLFFSDGRLFHAELGAAVGLDAVVQMLALRGGSIEPCAAPWPAQSSIDMGADALLLHAAQRLDERQLEVTQSRDGATTKVVRRVVEPARDGATTERFESAFPPPSNPAPQALGAPSREELAGLQVAQLDEAGVIQLLKGGATSDLADTAFFARSIATHVGEALGLGPCRALALEGPRESVVVFKARSLVAARGATRSVRFIRRRARLG